MRDSWHRSADHETWEPKCTGCLPVHVRPHECNGNATGFLGLYGGLCYCDETDCVGTRTELIKRKRAERDAMVADIMEQLRAQAITRDEMWAALSRFE